MIRDLEFIATGGLQADLTLWLDVPLTESIRRRGGQLTDRIEMEEQSFVTLVAAGFAVMATKRGWTRIDAGKPVDAVTKACCRAMVRTFGGRA
jgi:dTMP kinase